MIYVNDIETPANTPIASPLVTDMKISSGLIYKLEIDFPPGSYGLMGVTVWDGGHQIWPVDIGTYFRGDNVLISFDDLYLKETAPFILHVKTFNLDDTYDHSLTIRFGLVSKDIFLARFLPSIGYEDFVRQLKVLSEEQQQRYEEQNKQIVDHPFGWLPKEE